MSKLNDSTLKILKKYRLDTDMSVFGNENKLYDVVKVMDDMVGNQVGDIIGLTKYVKSPLKYSGNNMRQIPANTYNVKPYTLKSVNIDFSSLTHHYAFDPISMKFVGDNVSLSIKRVGYYVYASSKEYKKIGYVGISYIDNTWVAKLYADEYYTTEITNITINATIGYYFIPFICYGDNLFEIDYVVDYPSAWLTSMLEIENPTTSHSYGLSSSSIVEDNIVFPEILNNLNQIYRYQYYGWSPRSISEVFNLDKKIDVIKGEII